MTEAPLPPLHALARNIAEKCKSCKFCMKECQFLKDHGMPGDIAEKILAGDMDPAMAMKCSQCGLCTQVCTVRGLDPAALFVEMRRVAMSQDPTLKKPYKRLLSYEKIGLSSAMRYFHAPQGATTLLFPGCNLPGTRPDLVWDTFFKLRGADPKLGLALSCCSRPSLSLGLTELSEERLSGTIAAMEATGVSEVLVMCPNCLNTLRQAKPSFTVRTVYEVLAEMVPEAEPGMERVRTGVHDPCVLRGEREVHEAVRTLLWNTGSSVTEMTHSMHKAICCGEGAGVGVAAPEYADTWREKRAEEAVDRRVATYCGGCTLSLGPVVDAVHVLDLVLGPELGKEPRPAAKWTRPPLTYANRLRLKKKAKKLFSNT